MTTRELFCLAALAVSSMSAPARADDCPELIQAMAASRATIDGSIGVKPDRAIADLMSLNDAISQKLHSRCLGKYDEREQQAWARQQERKRHAAHICVGIVDPKERERMSDEDDSFVESEKLADWGDQCERDLLPFGDTLNPTLKECLAMCRKTAATFIQRSPECLDRIEQANALLGEMDAFIQKQKAGRPKDVTIDFSVFRSRYDRLGMKRCILPDTVPEVQTRFDRYSSEVNVLGHYELAMKDFQESSASQKNWFKPKGSAEACLMELVTIPARDAQLERIGAECRSLRDRSEAASHVTTNAGPVLTKKSGRKR
jgi:hypothetical protein